MLATLASVVGINVVNSTAGALALVLVPVETVLLATFHTLTIAVTAAVLTIHS
jgi:hypothetical protein